MNKIDNLFDPTYYCELKKKHTSISYCVLIYEKTGTHYKVIGVMIIFRTVLCSHGFSVVACENKTNNEP